MVSSSEPDATPGNWAPLKSPHTLAVGGDAGDGQGVWDTMVFTLVRGYHKLAGSSQVQPPATVLEPLRGSKSANAPKLDVLNRP